MMDTPILLEWLDPNGMNPGVTPVVTSISRTSILNGVGSGSVTLPKSDTRWQQAARYGNILRIHQQDQPSWVGVATQRTWEGEAVKLDLKSAEWLLQKKLTGFGLAFPSGMVGGDIAAGLFDDAYTKNGGYTALRRGLTDELTPRFVGPYFYADLYDSVKKLAEESGAQFWVDSDLRFHYRSRRGIDRNLVLREDVELFNVKVVDSIEDSLTHAVALGAGSNIVDKPIIARQNPVPYGYARAETLSADKLTSPDDLHALTVSEFTKRSAPRILIDATLSASVVFNLDDTAELVVFALRHDDGTGTSVRARLIGVEWPTSGQRRAILEVVPTQLAASVVWTP